MSSSTSPASSAAVATPPPMRPTSLSPAASRAAGHEADVLVAGGVAGRRDRVLDSGGNQGLLLADLRRRPVTENEQPRRRVWAVASPMAGVLVRGASCHCRTHPRGERVEDPRAGLTEPEPEHLTGRVAVGVPVEQHRRIAEAAVETTVGVARVATADVAVDRDRVGAEDLVHFDAPLWSSFRRC